MKPPSLTIGIEEEYQIIDPVTRELRSYITELLEAGKMPVVLGGDHSVPFGAIQAYAERYPGMGILHLVFGVLALQLFGWVNYAVAGWSTGG